MAIWKEAEEKVLRECGVDEAVIEQIRTDDRADFNSNRRFYRWASDFGEYLEGMADREKLLNFGRWKGGTETFSNGISGTGSLTRYGMKALISYFFCVIDSHIFTYPLHGFFNFQSFTLLQKLW